MAIAKYDHDLYQRYNLTSNDECYYFMLHKPGGYSASISNSKISNLKKDLNKKDTQEWSYRELAIKQFVNDLKTIGTPERTTIALVPGATSKPRNSTNWNNRIDLVVESFSKVSPNYRFEKLFDTEEDSKPSSHGGTRNVSDIKANTVWHGFSGLPTETVIIIDDVLTTGAHFKAWKEIILENEPHVKRIIGIFWALHVWPEL